MEITEQHRKKEKDKARLLRKSRWWHNLIQKTNCHYCNVPLSPENVTMDHILPISRGGRSTKGNVVPCCKPCNTEKKYLTPVEWDQYISSLSDDMSEQGRQKKL